VNAPRVLSGTARILRFTWAERMVHRFTAGLMLVCIATAAILYDGNLSIRVGHRHLVELVHVYCGMALPLPMVLGLLSRAYRADLSQLNRFTKSDWRWLRWRTRRAVASTVGKFNAGQKLNASLSCGATLVLFGTGILMYFVGLSPLAWRTGATFVHDWFALGVVLLVCGHVYKAVRDAEARRGMRCGSVDARWARNEHPAWAEEHPGGPPQAESVRGADGTNEQ
jgi:formate dehydrogenase subunit gamma